ncbi:MAG TPA: gliding motility-associated C-terminal domain-containing protein, partial [Segetibacter sp.]
IVRPFTIYDNKAVAGRDTIVAWDEPVQLNAHGGANVTYVWTPSLGLNNPALENPIATLDRDQLYRLDAVTDKGCDSHSTIMIKRFKGPDLYIPTAFTPNGDGLNEVLRVFPVGIKSFNYFAVYNRLGQKIFYTTNFHEGWNGTLNGVKLDGGTFAVYASAIDYRGNLMERKNTVTLIR